MAHDTEIHAGASHYLRTIHEVLDRVGSTQLDAVEAAARLCATAILGGGLVHAFGSGHSRMVVEELWPRYGSFPGFHPLVELSVNFYHQVVGSNGIRQAMFLENVTGLAARMTRNFRMRPPDAMLAVSSGGTSVVTVEVAELAKAAGLPVIAVTSVQHSRLSTPRAPSGNRLFDVADVVLDTCTPVGDAAVDVPGVEGRVGPTTTVAAAAIVNMMKVRVAELLVAGGQPPPVLASSLVVGESASSAVFEEAFDQHAIRVARALDRS